MNIVYLKRRLNTNKLMVTIDKLKIGNVLSVSRDNQVDTGMVTEIFYDPLTFIMLTFSNRQKTFCGETLADDCVFVISSIDDVSCNQGE